MAMKRNMRMLMLVVIVVAAIVARVLRAAGSSSFPVLIPAILGLLGVAMLAGTGHQAYVWARSFGVQRQAERLRLLTNAGLLVAGILYAFTTETGMGWLGLGDLSTDAHAKYDTVMTIAMGIIGLCAFVPAVMIEATVGRWQATSDDGVELHRSHEVGRAGLTIALAASFLMVTCYVARERNIKQDLSYFRTSAPGESTRKIVDQGAPLRVLLFFPEQNEVGQEVAGYFQELGRTTGKIGIELHDRRLAGAIAQKYKVKNDGTVVLVRGNDKDERWSMFEIATDMQKARRQTGRLRVLDQTVNTALLELLLAKRKVYLTVGHGEVNDPDSLPPDLRGKLPDGRATVMKNILTQMSYERATIGAMDGLASAIPADATFVLVLGPKTAFATAELEALARYLDGGGRALIAMDPRGDFRLGPLEGRLGVGLGELRPGQPERIGIVTDDKNFLPVRRSDSDRQLALTNQFSAHAATTSLSRARMQQGILLETAGALFDREFTTAGEAPRRTYLVRTMADAWLDYNGDFKLDGDEKRERYNIGAAIEGPPIRHADGSQADGFRALVFSDQHLFSDHAQEAQPMKLPKANGGPLPADAIKWLTGEENIAGIVNNEQETEIKQTPRVRAGWFVGITVAAPLGVLGFGLLFARRARRRPRSDEKKEKVS